MILGHGIDLINENRIEDILNRHGRRFEEKYFSESEIARAKENYKRSSVYAKCWACKEAFSKGAPQYNTQRAVRQENEKEGNDKNTFSLTPWLIRQPASRQFPIRLQRGVCHVSPARVTKEVLTKRPPEVSQCLFNELVACEVAGFGNVCLPSSGKLLAI